VRVLERTEGVEGEGEGETEVEECAEGAGPRAGPLEQERRGGRGKRAGQPEPGRRPSRKGTRWAGAMPHPRLRRLGLRV
jgi:hypothetical protein